jgi:NAD(P)-dependent dehydrogenase (short-subunit alcohol dehydrogenase family)
MSESSRARVAVITGASGGIGSAVARRLARDGAQCVLAGQSREKLGAVASEITAAGGLSPVIVAGDLRQAEHCQMLAHQVESLGRADVFVSCAGATRAGPFGTLDDSAWVDGFELKFHAAVRITRLLWPLLARSEGSVVYVAGAAARYPSADFLIGGSVNAALANFAKGLAGLGIKDNVNVNTIHPNMTLTSRLETLVGDRAKAAGVSYEEMMARDVASAGTRRLSHPDDVANLVAFLSAPESRQINGTATGLDGGAGRASF